MYASNSPLALIWYRPTVALLLIAIALFFSAGCGESGAERYGLSGEVTFAGKPVPAGMIYFEPDIGKGNKGPQGFAQITDGKYNTDQFGKGAVSGPLLVSISGFSNDAASDGESSGKPLFPRYTTRIELPKEAGTFNFDVPARR